jgi:hypothetical protein
VQWISGALSKGLKRPRREAVYSLSSSGEVKNAFVALCLVKHRNNVTVTFIFEYVEESRGD